MRIKRLYDDVVKDTLCGYVLAGETPMSVSKRCDVSAEVLRRWCRERGIEWARPTSKYDQDLVNEIVLSIFDRKTTTAEASRKYGIHESALQRACHKAGVTSNGRGKNLKKDYLPLSIEARVEMSVAKLTQDLLTDWKRDADLFDYIPKAQKWSYIRRFLYV